MKDIHVKYLRKVNAIQRNGMIKQSGISIWRFDFMPEVHLQAITSKGEGASGFLQIPIESIKSVIDALQEIHKTYTDEIMDKA